MADSYLHLLPTTRLVANQPNSVRLTYLMSDRWVSYAAADRILALLDDLLTHPKVIRMPGMLIVGRRNNGKSSLVQRFTSLHPGEDNPSGPNIIAHVLPIQAPPKPSEAACYDAITYALSRRPRSNQDPGEKRRYVVELLKEVEVKVLLVDEINNVIAGSTSSQRIFLNTLKYIGNECRISIVATGTQEALRVVQTDPQIASRLKPEPLPLWPYGLMYRELLANLEQVVPLREPSNLSTGPLARLIHSRTDETIGSTAEIVNAAAKWAIQNGKEKIDEKAITSCGYRSPAEIKADTAKI
jgi:hypothetical protein